MAKKMSPDAAKKGRLSPEMRQEQDSLNQIRYWLKGWNPGSYERDLGEDLVVQIYDEDGSSTGLSFQIQAKSTTNLGQHEAGVRTTVPQRLDVKDLTHWEDTSPPVVVILWDVGLQRGVWQDVPAIISTLDKAGTEWRSKGTVTVQLPLANTTDCGGRSAIRHRVAELALPLFKDRPLQVDCAFSFPKTEEGMATFTQLHRAIDEGEEVTISREHIVSLKHSSWWERLFGSATQVQSLKIGPGTSTATLEVLLTAVGPDRTEEIPILLKGRRAGMKKTVLDNHDDNAAVRMSLTYETTGQGARIHTTFSFRLLGKNLAESQRLVRFFEALHGGARMVLCMSDGSPVAPTQDLSLRGLPPREELAAVADVLQKLSFVQASLRSFVEFDLSGGINPEHRKAIDKLHSYFSTGSWEERPSTITLGLKRPAQPLKLRRRNKPNIITMESPSVTFDIFGVTIPLGTVRGELVNQEAFFSAWDEAVRTGASRVTIKNPTVRMKVVKPSADAPSQSQVAGQKITPKKLPGGRPKRRRRG